MKTIMNNLKRATIEMVLLSLLCEEDMYGYQIAQQLKKRSNNEYAVLEGSMYPILYRLNEKGCVTFESRQITEKLTRVYYHITDEGKQYLQEVREYYMHCVEIINQLAKCDNSEQA